MPNLDIAAMQRAEARRQKVLEFLRAHPFSGYDEIKNQFPDAKTSTIHSTLSAMSRMREIASAGKKNERAYIALVEITKTTFDMIEERRAKNRANYQKSARASGRRKNNSPDKPPMAIVPPKRDPWHYVHRDHRKETDPPIPNQGGQGALRRDVFVNCEQF